MSVILRVKIREGLTLEEVYVDSIEIPDWARKINRDYLHESLSERGIIYPILLGRLPDGRLLLIDGMGRLEWYKMQGIKKIKAFVIDVRDEEEAIKICIEVNTVRKNLSKEYIYQLIIGMKRRLVRGETTRKELAKALRTSESMVYRYLYLETFPDSVREAFLRDYLAMYAIDKIVKARNAGVRMGVIERMIQKILDAGLDKETATQTLIDFLERAIKMKKEKKGGDLKTDTEVSKAVEEMKSIDNKYINELRVFWNNLREITERLSDYYDNIPAELKSFKKNIKKAIKKLEDAIDIISFYLVREGV